MTYTFSSGIRHAFAPDATTPGFNVGSLAGNPSSLSNGDLWYNSSTGALMARIGGSSVALGAAQTVTASRAVVSDGSGALTASAVTAAEIGYLSGIGGVSTGGNGAADAAKLVKFNGTGGLSANEVSGNSLSATGTVQGALLSLTGGAENALISGTFTVQRDITVADEDGTLATREWTASGFLPVASPVSTGTAEFENVDVSGALTLGTPLAVAEGGTGSATAGDARTALGLGSMATQASNNVSITGGSVTGITDIAIADGGTGQSTAQRAIGALAPAWFDIHWDSPSGYGTGTWSGTIPTYVNLGRVLTVTHAASTAGTGKATLGINASQKIPAFPCNFGNLAGSSIVMDWSKPWTFVFCGVVYLGGSGSKVTWQLGVVNTLASHTLSGKAAGIRWTAGASNATVEIVHHNGTSEATTNAGTFSNTSLATAIWALHWTGSALELYKDGTLLATASTNLPSGNGTAGHYEVQLATESTGTANGVCVRVLSSSVRWH